MNACWISLKKSHDVYIVTCFTDIEESDLYLETFTRKYIDVEDACDNFTRKNKECCDRKATRERENSIKLERIEFHTSDSDVQKKTKFKSDFNQICCSFVFKLSNGFCSEVLPL